MNKDNNQSNTTISLPSREMLERQRRALFPGSFNPFTKGHADIVERALKLFDSVIVAVGYNEHKSDESDIAERVTAIQALYKYYERVKVISYSSLTVEVARQEQVCAILRSVRCVKDYEYELLLADINRRLTGIETVILFARPELASISSSVIRELQHFGFDTTDFLPQ